MVTFSSEQVRQRVHAELGYCIERGAAHAIVEEERCKPIRENTVLFGDEEDEVVGSQEIVRLLRAGGCNVDTHVVWALHRSGRLRGSTITGGRRLRAPKAAITLFLTEPFTRTDLVGLIRREVVYRSGERCENPDCARETRSVEMDHWHGGPDRKRLEGVETCWVLCVPCHRDRQANRPSAAVWNDRFRRHCERHGYPFRPHVEHASLPPGGRVA